jgi:hypothetical protein
MTTPFGPGGGAPDPGLTAIMNERQQLINLAYRMPGSLAEAEDAVQEACARWYAMSERQREAIESPGAWLATVASRVCLDLLGSARARRERYVGEWLPEPLPGPAEWPGAGGLATAQPSPIEGSEQVARACAEVARVAPGLTLLERTVNGQPGLVAQLEGVTVAVVAFDVTGDRIKHIWAVRKPDKLRPWTTG